MGHVQDSPVATTMISNEFMIYHMKVHIISYNLGQKKISKSKIHILTISGQTDSKPAIVMLALIRSSSLNYFEKHSILLKFIFLMLFSLLYQPGTRKNEVKELQTDHQNFRLPTWFGCLGCQQAAGYPKTQFLFYVLNILPTYPVL